MRSMLAIIVWAAAVITASAAAVVPNFKLLDYNPKSPRRNVLVSPRDYLFQVSGYYFGAAH